LRRLRPIKVSIEELEETRRPQFIAHIDWGNNNKAIVMEDTLDKVIDGTCAYLQQLKTNDQS
jgi:hypothetical protein